MSTDGNDIFEEEKIEETEDTIKEETKVEFEKFDLKTFWSKYKYKILAGCVGIGYLALNAKIKATNARITASYNKMDNKIGNYMNDEIIPKINQLHKDSDDLFENCTILKNDINNLATHTGYQGQLGVNRTFE